MRPLHKSCSLAIAFLAMAQVLAEIGGIPSQAGEPSHELTRAASELQAALQKLMEPSRALSWTSSPVEPPAELRRQMESFARLMTLHPDAELRLRTNGTVRLLRAHDMARGNAPQAGRPVSSAASPSPFAAAAGFIDANRGLFGLESPAEELTLLSEDRDDLGHNHVRMGLQAGGVPVTATQISAHFDSSGALASIDGTYVPTPRLPTFKPTIPATEAIERAKTMLGTTNWLASDALLVIHAPLEGTPRLAWRFILTASVTEAREIFASALDGEILGNLSAVHDENIATKAYDYFNNLRDINVWRSGGTHFMVDTSKPSFDPTSNPLKTPVGAISIYDLAGQPFPGRASRLVYTTNLALWTPRDAVSAAFNLGKTYDYYRSRFGRNSIDGKGGSIKGIVRVGAYDNASWHNEIQGMVFGDIKPFAAALDVVAHEVTHGVTAHSAGLLYRGESGAINEAMSDIFGEMTEAMAKGTNDWLLGTELGSPDRSLVDPASLRYPGGPAYPTNYNQYWRLPDSRDHGGVHFNSSIINHAFYQLSAGLPDSLGNARAEKIFYRALTVHLQPQSDFPDCALAAVSSAEELFGKGSPEASVTEKAFAHVGLFLRPATPPPARTRPVDGPESYFFIRYIAADKSYQLRRYEQALDTNQSSLFATNVYLCPPAVTPDGKAVVFITRDYRVAVAGTDAPSSVAYLSYRATAVAISPDGRFIAFVDRPQDGSTHVPTITIIPMGSGMPKIFSVSAPSYGSDISLEVSDILGVCFKADGTSVFFEAITSVQFDDYLDVADSIFEMDTGSGRVDCVTPPFPGIYTTNPSASRTSDRYVAFDLQLSSSNTNHVCIRDLYTGRTHFVFTNLWNTSYNYPGFNGDDGRLLLCSFDRFVANHSSLYQVQLSQEKSSLDGGLEIVRSDAKMGVSYRRGLMPPSNVAPSLTLNGMSDVFESPAVARVSGTASDPDGAVRLVEVYQGRDKVGSAVPGQGGGFQFDIPLDSPGNRLFVVRAIDDLDAVAERDLTVSVLRAGEFRPELRTFWQDGIPRLRAKGIPDQSFVLMISTNLLQWSPLRTNQFGSTGSYLLSLTSSTNADAQRRFYKVTRLP